MMKEPPAMAGQAPAVPAEERPEPVASETQEKTSVFIPKEALGKRECKAGDKLTFTVKDVDQETGEVEATIDGYDDKPESNAASTSDAIDEMAE